MHLQKHELLVEERAVNRRESPLKSCCCCQTGLKIARSCQEYVTCDTCHLSQVSTSAASSVPSGKGSLGNISTRWPLHSPHSVHDSANYVTCWKHYIFRYQGLSVLETFNIYCKHYITSPVCRCPQWNATSALDNQLTLRVQTHFCHRACSAKMHHRTNN